MLGPYNKSVFPYYYFHCTPYSYCCVHVVPICLLLMCTIEAHYCYFCALRLLLLCRL